METYDLYGHSESLGPISLTDDNKYINETTFDDNFIPITVWTSGNSPAVSGYYLSINEIQDTSGNKTYNVKLCNLTFNANGVATSGDPKTLS